MEDYSAFWLWRLLELWTQLAVSVEMLHARHTRIPRKVLDFVVSGDFHTDLPLR